MRLTFILFAMVLAACNGSTHHTTSQPTAVVGPDAMLLANDADSIAQLQDHGADNMNADGSNIEEALQAAGNTNDEDHRFELLSALSETIEADDPLRTELIDLLDFLDRWVNGRARYWVPGEQAMSGEGGYLANFFVNEIWPNQFNRPTTIREDSPLYPLWAFYRARLLVWSTIQHGLLEDSAFAEAQSLMQTAREAYPDNRVIGMYLDDPIPWASPVVVDQAAPRWANQQRELLSKLMMVIEFWVTKRQTPDGQFGGGWGDDVELWRWWSPLLIAYDVPWIRAAQSRLSEGVFSLARLAGGYSSILSDVEHSAEDSSDTITPMLLLAPDSDIWRSRAERIAELMSTLWMAENEDGHWQFKSSYLSSDAVDERPSRACNTPYHARVAQPVLRLWQLSQDEALATLLTRWLDTWVAATARAEYGKPAGILPAAIEFPSGQTGISGEPWYDPGCHINRATFRFPRAVSLLGASLAIAAALSGDTRFLAPIESAIEMADLADPQSEVGGLAWAADQLDGKFVSSIEKYRILSEDERFDSLLESRGSAYVRFVLNGDLESLETRLASLQSAMLVDFEAHTQEVRFTDRVFKFHRRYANQFRTERVNSISPTVLYEMLTGDFGDPSYGAAPGVVWQGDPLRHGILVSENTRRSFVFQVYRFTEDTDPLIGKLLRLRPGTYAIEMNGVQREERMNIMANTSGQLIMNLQPKMVTTVRIERLP